MKGKPAVGSTTAFAFPSLTFSAGTSSHDFERGLSEGAKRTEGEQKGEQKVVGGTKTKTKTEIKIKTKREG